MPFQTSSGRSLRAEQKRKCGRETRDGVPSERLRKLPPTRTRARKGTIRPRCALPLTAKSKCRFTARSARVSESVRLGARRHDANGGALGRAQGPASTSKYRPLHHLTFIEYTIRPRHVRERPAAGALGPSVQMGPGGPIVGCEPHASLSGGSPGSPPAGCRRDPRADSLNPGGLRFQISESVPPVGPRREALFRSRTDPLLGCFKDTLERACCNLPVSPKNTRTNDVPLRPPRPRADWSNSSARAADRSAAMDRAASWAGVREGARNSASH